MTYDDAFSKIIRLDAEFAAARDHLAALLRECERLGMVAPRDIWLSTMGPAAGWRERMTLVAYTWANGVECWEDGNPALKRTDAATAAAWLKGKVNG